MGVSTSSPRPRAPRYGSLMMSLVALFGGHSEVSLAQVVSETTPLKAVRVNGALLHYLDQGKGVSIVLVHGGLEDYRTWLPQMKALTEHHRTISYSRRYNYPNSNAPAAEYSAAMDAEDLASLIRKLELAPAHIVGVSYGAYTALLLAAREPSLVRSLVLSEAPVLSWLPELPGGRPVLSDFMSKVWEPTTRAFRKSDKAGVRAAIDGFGNLGYSGSEVKLTYDSLPPHYQDSLLQNAPEWRALTASKDAFPALSMAAVRGIKAPVLLLSGQRSLVLHGLLDEQLRRLLPNSERIILPVATHEMWSEFPEECRAATLAFVTKH